VPCEQVLALLEAITIIRRFEVEKVAMSRQELAVLCDIERDGSVGSAKQGMVEREERSGTVFRSRQSASFAGLYLLLTAAYPVLVGLLLRFVFAAVHGRALARPSLNLKNFVAGR
jgi:hypothetical protein